MKVRTRIIPDKVLFYKLPGHRHELDLKGICVFSALGFFLDNDTYWKDTKSLRPGCEAEIDDQGFLVDEKSYFNWHYDPAEIPFTVALDEFAKIFESTVKTVLDRKIILPLSGGLDSRTIAAALGNYPQVQAMSYEFKNGIHETKYAGAVARACGMPFESYIIPPGYLWGNLAKLAEINGCDAEFTHPRQAAVMKELGTMGDLFLLGHGGDLFFDSMGVKGDDKEEDQLHHLEKKLVRRGGLEFGEALWASWGLQGTFKSYLQERLSDLLGRIKIDEANARLRAFKSRFYVSRWTVSNLDFFSHVKPYLAPYFTDEMCRFICRIPEAYLKGRQLQIEYLKMRTPHLARIPWQAHRPFNVMNYHLDKFPWNTPFRLNNKLKSWSRALTGRPFIQRNWELQFLGTENSRHLEDWLLHNPEFTKFIPVDVVREFYARFNKDPLGNAHSVSMLLTFALFAHREKTEKGAKYLVKEDVGRG